MAVARARYWLERGAVLRRGTTLRRAPGLPAQALAVVALLYLGATEGGFFPTDWYPIGLVVLALVAIWGLAVPCVARPTRATIAALVLLGLFAAWSVVSMTWAGDAAAAWDGGNRALLYAALFALFSLWTTGAREARWLLALVGLGIAAVGTVELLRFAAAADPQDYLLGGRLSEPVGYQNGNVAFWLMGALACISLAASREPHPLIRGSALGGASVLASLALMGQSRGSLFALPVAVVFLLALSPGRLRVLAALGAVAAGVAFAAGPVIDVVDAADSPALPGLLDEAARAIVLPSAVLAALGAAAALADLRWTPSADALRRTRRVGAGLLAVTAVALAGVALAQAGELRSELSQRWEEFKSNDDAAEGTARLSSAGTNRYDFWTVAWESFEREPVRGVGSDNFQQDYLARGDTSEKPRYPHSLELAVLSQTGLVGGLLFAAGLGAALAAALALRRRLTRPGAAAVAAALTVFLYCLLHASVDWLYELPALGGLGFALLGLATAVRDDDPPPAPAGRTVRVAAPLLAVAAAVSFALPWLAEREIDRALDVWPESSAAAYRHLDRAADINFVSARPALYKGSLAIRAGQPARAERAFKQALEREPRNAYAWLELAALASAQGDRAAARRRIRRAIRLDPRDEATRFARDRIAAGGRITPRDVNRAILEYRRGGSE